MQTKKRFHQPQPLVIIMNRFNPSDLLESFPIAVATQKPGGHPNPSAMIAQSTIPNPLGRPW